MTKARAMLRGRAHNRLLQRERETLLRARALCFTNGYFSRLESSLVINLSGLRSVMPPRFLLNPSILAYARARVQRPAGHSRARRSGATEAVKQ